ncbi:TPA: hypothetical protein DF272_06170 [Candidatus Falkowbacteria bacterium]|nr:hypothetical protein [Candidatus Falkowbacteria bacterium]
MKKQWRYLGGILSVLLLMVLLTGCTKTPESVVDKMIAKMAAVKTYQFDATVGLKGTMAALEQGLQLSNESSETKIKAKGQVDMRNDDNVKYVANLDVAFQAEGTALTLKADLLTTSQATYIKVNEAPQIALMDFSQLKDTWYKFQAADGTAESGEEPLSASQVRKIKKLFQNTDFFTVAEDYGTEDLNGIKTYHYRVKLNGDELKRFFVEMKTIVDEQEPTTQEFEEIQANLAKWSGMEGDVWIGTNDYYLYQVNVGANIEEENSDLERMDLSLSMSAYNEPVTIDIPANAKIMDWAEIMGVNDATIPAGTDQNLTKQLEDLNLSDEEMAVFQKQLEALEAGQ